MLIFILLKVFTFNSFFKSKIMKLNTYHVYELKKILIKYDIIDKKGDQQCKKY